MLVISKANRGWIHSHYIGVAYMIAAQAMLAVMAACVRALKTLPLMEVVFLRSLAGAMMIAGYMLFCGYSFSGCNKKNLVMRGLIGFSALVSYYFSITHLNLATATVLASTAPVFSAILAVVFLGERLQMKTAILIVFSLLGVYLLVAPDWQSNRYYSFGLLTAILIALVFLYIRKLKDENAYVVVFYFVFISTLASFPWAIHGWVTPTIEQWGLLLLIALTTFFGQLWLTSAFRYGQTAVISSVSNIGPVFCWMLGLYFFAEQIQGSSLLGAVIVLVASISMTYLPKTNKQD